METCSQCSKPLDECICVTRPSMSGLGLGLGLDTTIPIESAADEDIALPLRSLSSSFKYLKTLGRGSASTVYLMEHLTLARPVALKILHRDKLGSQTAVQRFEREARTLAALNHPGFVEIYELGITEDGSPYIVMEYAAGLSLKALLKALPKTLPKTFPDERGALEPGRVRALGAKLCEALQFAHDHGVIHRDIKPENIVLTTGWSGEETPRLVDFGVSFQEFEGGEMQRLTRTGKLIGTPGYLSPEQIRGTGVSPRSDIYSLGSVLYEALTGKPAFYTGNVMETLTRQLDSEPPRMLDLKPGLDKSLVRAVESCLSKDPEKRPDSAAALTAMLVPSAPARTVRPGVSVVVLMLVGLLCFAAGWVMDGIVRAGKATAPAGQNEKAAASAGKKEAPLKSGDRHTLIDLARAEITRSTATSAEGSQIYLRNFERSLDNQAPVTEQLACAVFAILPAIIEDDPVAAEKVFIRIKPVIDKTIESGDYKGVDALFCSYILAQYASLQVRQAIDLDHASAVKLMAKTQALFEQSIMLAKPRSKIDTGGILGGSYTGLGVIQAFNKDLVRARQSYKLAFDWRLKTQGPDRLSTLESLKLLIHTSIALCKNPGVTPEMRQTYLNTAKDALDKVVPHYKKTDNYFKDVVELRDALLKAYGR
ncbi:MAG: serine/threonine-protein kinase [Candidatus Obscuribacterales bacterium]